ncbi:hypothetical protein D6C90_02499, partial [Aureobasidium pullulans]
QKHLRLVAGSDEPIKSQQTVAGICDEQQPTCGLCKKIKKMCTLAEKSTTSKPSDGFTLPNNASPAFGQEGLSFRTYQHPYRICRRNDPIDDMLNSFHMTRGIRTVLERQWQIEQVKFDPDAGPVLNDEDPWQQDLMSEYPPYPVLRDLINTHCTIQEDILVCLDATRKIFSFITLLEECPNLHPDARLVQIWPIEIKKRFFDMLIARKPIALLILGYYSVPMRLRSDTMWPLHEWPSKLLQRVEEVLGDEWLEYLEWPKSRVLDLIDEEECVSKTSVLSC